LRLAAKSTKEAVVWAGADGQQLPSATAAAPLRLRFTLQAGAKAVLVLAREQVRRERRRRGGRWSWVCRSCYGCDVE
jgi:hypothetical protein